MIADRSTSSIRAPYLPIGRGAHASYRAWFAAMVEVQITLYATVEPVSTDGLTAFYKGKDAFEVRAVLDKAPSIVLGITDVAEPSNGDDRGPIGRLDDELSRRGTETWPPSALPVLDEDLERALLHAFQPQPGERPRDVVDESALRAFLREHRGYRLATWATASGS